jgi:2-polyprenyl-6-methoxyphenol hydroxylase-like FAD-dependent oxidoreductase
MEKTSLQQDNMNWMSCPECQSQGKKTIRIRKRLRLRYQKKVEKYALEKPNTPPPTPPSPPVIKCLNCNGSGLVLSEIPVSVDENTFPHIAIIGGGIGGVAFAVACLHRGIPFTLYERDISFESRSQGYGLTLQQASKAIKGFGLTYLEDGIISTQHKVHTASGKVIGEWGSKKWLKEVEEPHSKRINIHIGRQALRKALLDQLGGESKIEWNHQLIQLKENEDGVELHFQVDNEIRKTKADLVIGADGIRSSVRRLILGETQFPLRYLGCIVILGICPVKNIKDNNHPLLDLSTVFQTANGIERIYVMPYSRDTLMWQLSFPIPEDEALRLSQNGPQALKEEAIKRTPWHDPIPELLEATSANQISGYPAYDRELLQKKDLHFSRISLLGDAAHPMSPFKGQGANQALLDALALARLITQKCKNNPRWKEDGIRETFLNDYEIEMLERSAVKVTDSADAAKILHSEHVLKEVNEPRCNSFKREKTKNID